MRKVAILLTCFNRKEKTILCLTSLYNAIKEHRHCIIFDIYLVDDGSTDGTSEEINKNFKEVTIIQGSGNLFWSQGMSLAWQTAISTHKDYDSFMFLNDDVILFENFINDLLQTHDFCLKNKNRYGIYVCSTIDPTNSRISYGGNLITKKGIKYKTTRINPSKIPTECCVANGNILMITKPVMLQIGILDPKYIHQCADFDYTLTASRSGIPVLVCPGVGGCCARDHGKKWLSGNFSFKDRVNYLYSPKGLAYKERIYYLKKNFKFQLPYYFIMMWLKTLFPFFWDKFKKEDPNLN